MFEQKGESYKAVFPNLMHTACYSTNFARVAAVHTKNKKCAFGMQPTSLPKIPGIFHTL